LSRKYTWQTHDKYSPTPVRGKWKVP